MAGGGITTATGFLTYLQDKADGTPVYGITDETTGTHYLVAGDYSAYAGEEVILRGVVGHSDAGLTLDVTSVHRPNRPLVSVDTLLQAASWLLGAPYRPWFPGWPIPMWRRDGVGDPPPLWHLQQVGVMGSDLINYALEANGRPPGGGTGTFENYLVRKWPFDPASPGQAGAIALRPYEGPAPSQQGHIALYLGEHQIIQSIPSAGVTAQYTDEETYAWAAQGWPQYGFTIYGLLRGVQYP
jgi:hypothetical protein